MEFGCDFCDFETDNEDEIVYCDCGKTICENHTHTKEYQGFQDAFCPDCKKDYHSPKWN